LSKSARATRLEDRALSSAFPGFLLLLITVAQPLLLVPILLSGWGDARFGVWILLTSTAATLQSLDAGFQGYLGNEFNRVYAENPAGLRGMVSSALRICYCLGSVHLLLGLGLVFSGGFEQLLPTGLSLGEIADARGTFLVMVVHWSVLGSVTGLLGRVFAPVGLYARSQWWGFVSRSGFLIAVAATALTGGNLTAAWTAAAITSFVVCVALVIDMRRHLHPWLSWWEGGSFRSGLTLFFRSLLLSGVGLAEGLVATGLLIFLGSQFQAGGLAIFATLRTMSGLLGQVAMLVVSPITPDLVRFFVQRDGAKLDDTLRVLRLLILGGGGAALVLLAAVAEPLYRVWTRGAVVFDYPAFALLSWAAFVRLGGLPEGITLRSLNRNHLVLILVAVQAAVLFSSLALLHRFPLTWVAAGCIAAADFLSGWLLPRFLLARELRRQGVTVSGLTGGLGLIFGVGAALLAGIFPMGRWLIVLPGLAGAALYIRHSWRELSPVAQARLTELFRNQIGRLRGWALRSA
jgi:O-antigen/teichoic acid export membrane protein